MPLTKAVPRLYACRGCETTAFPQNILHAAPKKTKTLVSSSSGARNWATRATMMITTKRSQPLSPCIPRPQASSRERQDGRWARTRRGSCDPCARRCAGPGGRKYDGWPGLSCTTLNEKKKCRGFTAVFKIRRRCQQQCKCSNTRQYSLLPCPCYHNISPSSPHTHNHLDKKKHTPSRTP